MKNLILLIAAMLVLSQSGRAQYTNNYVAYFNGFYSYASYGMAPAPTSAFTLEAWVNPQTLNPWTMAVIGKNYQTGYFLGIQSTGRIVFYPKGSSSLRSRINSNVLPDRWTHIAATYDGMTTAIYINGILDTTTTAITGPLTLNNDTMYIGADRVGVTNLFYTGYIDNVRIWERACSAAEISNNRFIPINAYSPSGTYQGLRASFLFDNDVRSMSGNGTEGFPRDVTFINYSNKAVNNCDYNNNLVLNGVTDYCSHDNGNQFFSMQNSFTVEAWVKRDTTGTQPIYQNIVTKSGGTMGLDYGIYFSAGGDFYFAINNFNNILQAPAMLTTAQWTHFAVSYYPSEGRAIIYCNGDSVAGSVFQGSFNVQNSPYKIYFGASGASNQIANKYKGQLDDIKIWYRGARTQKQIRETMFANKIEDMSTADSVAYFSFDYVQTGFQHGASSHIGGLKYFGNAYVSSAHGPSNYLSSPVLKDPKRELQNSYFQLSKEGFFVPDAPSAGVTDSIYISEGSAVNNLRVLLLMSHSYVGDVDVRLVSPSGISVLLLDRNGGGGNDAMTVFSDDADSSASGNVNLNGPGINAPFSPMIKSKQSLSSFNGQNRNGWWKLKIRDYAGGDIGYVVKWGLNMNSQMSLNLSGLIQGFYNSNTNKMTKDTVTVLLRKSTTPYQIIDSARSLLDSNGKAKYYFKKSENVTSYYIVLKHRNSIDTWSAGAVSFSNDTLSCDFTSNSNKAFGNNEILVDSSPLKYAIYGGDVNRDKTVDLSDLTRIYNGTINFETGYSIADLTGDLNVDLSDVIIAFNNSKNFVSVVSP